MTITFESVSVKDLVTYKNATLPLNAHPVMVIRGRNNDRRSRKSSNASGKSLICSAIPLVRYGAPPTDNAKRSARLVHRKGSEIRIRLQSQGKPYDVVQFQKGRSLAYDVVEDNTPRNYRESKEAFARIGQIIPISEDQFYTFNYLDARREHPLHMGTSARRFEFFEKVFSLDVFDRIAKRLNTQYNDLKYQVQQLKEAESEYALRSAEMPKAKMKALKAKRADLMARAEKVRKKVNRCLTELRQLTAYMTLAEGIPGDISRKALKEELRDARGDENALEKTYREAVKYHAAREEAAKSAEQKRELLAEHAKQMKRWDKLRAAHKFLAKVKKSGDLDPLIEVCTEEGRKTRDQLTQAVMDNESRSKLKARLKEFGFSKEKREKYSKLASAKIKDRIAAERQKIKGLAESLDVLRKHSHGNSGECPTCFQPLNAKARTKLVESCEAGIKEAGARIKKWNNVLGYLELADRIKALPAETMSVPELDARLEKQRKQYKVLQEAKALLHDLEQARVKIAFLKSTDVPKQKIGKPEVYEDTLRDLRKRIKRTESLIERLDKLDELGLSYGSYAEAKQRYDHLQAYIDKYQPLLDKAQEALQTMTVKLTRAESLSAELEKLSGRIKKHKDATTDYAVYEALRQTYGANGLRKMRTAMLAATFEQDLNRFAPLLFAEPVKFTINVTNSRFDILCERNNKPPADVKTLSGSEGRCFVLLASLALLPYVPANARSNLLILDEMESLLDDASRELLVAEYLPLLNTIIPNIIIVTSHSRATFNIPGAVGYTVVKKGGVSSLVPDTHTDGRKAA